MYLIKKGKELAWLTRHDSESFENGIIDINGWRSVDDLIENHGYTVEMLEEIVSTDDKNRYEFDNRHMHVRARQGHSIPVEIDFDECVPPDVLYHGTALKHTLSIQKNGINSGNRLYVHLSKDIPTAMQVGNRHGIPAAFEIDAKQMYKDGIVFYLTTNDVWLVKHVEPKYIKLIGKL